MDIDQDKDKENYKDKDVDGSLGGGGDVAHEVQTGEE